MNDDTKQQLLGNIRYAIRLTQRTARLYRRVQTVGIFLSIVGGSAAMTSIATNIPAWVSSAGGVIFAIAGAMLIAVRPSDKAAQNEYDARRYQELMVKAVNMNEDELILAIEEAHQGDAPEIESLRNVAYNDVALEFNRPDMMFELSALQRLLKSLACIPLQQVKKDFSGRLK
ncbi:hypothetical protein W03_09680 [Nitrosomonas sp. PY1]|uniref:hypothetical protein n=1 Tax=Nitrosomonas sp. PY1 TaxID=1803906 RepID=UPI001FC80315|nr:hypothetical protein [Nitrosomonas sp. PY1]GKS68964.1 hypothetical protein W03_09680 [Nitrosomonas sp. PY1]